MDDEWMDAGGEDGCEWSSTRPEPDPFPSLFGKERVQKQIRAGLVQYGQYYTIVGVVGRIVMHEVH